MTCRPRCKLRLRGDDVCEGITHARLQVDKDSSGNVVLVIRLIEEYIFAVAAFRSPFLQYAFVVDAVLRTQALPVHRTHLHDALDTCKELEQMLLSLWFPHCPSWTVTISRGMTHR